MNFEEVADKQRVYAKIDLKAVRLNMDNMHKNLSDKTKMMAVVKTNGYGFGAVEISNMLEKLDYIWGYATATVEEAFELRENGIKKPILILGYVFPYAYEKMLREDIRPAVFRFDQLEELNECAKKIALDGSVKKKIHIAVDTGMSRIGICPDENGAMFVKKALNMSNLEVEGIFTHFARADEADLTDAHHKKDVFAGFVEKVEKENKIRIPLHHCANSASIIDMPEAQMDMVRAGVTMYGMKPMR